jgi:PEP-CTERM motif
MKLAILMLAVVALILSGTGQLKAGFIVYQPLNTSQTGPQYGEQSDGVDSGSGGRQEIASGFTLTSDAAVVDVQWWGAYRDGSTPSAATTFLIRFYSDSNDLPGSLISQQDVSVAGVSTGLDNSGGLPILFYDSNISTVSLSGGSTYWISILEDDPSTPFADQWIWQFSDVGDVPYAGSNTDGLSWSGGPQQGPGANMAFTLSDGSVSAVPEPASVTLLGTAFVPLACYFGWRRRRRFRFAVSFALASMM